MLKQMAKPIVMVTGNPNKLHEVLHILGPDFKNKVTSQNVDLPEYQGTSYEIVTSKCKLAADLIKGPVIVEDTSLCFNALGGMPGPYIKWFLDAIGPSGLYKMLDGFEDKTAYAQCVFGYSSGQPGSPVEIFDGRCCGQIVEPRGSTAFGWDPCFQPDNFEQTFAEMEKSIKNSISHRSQAVAALKSYLIKNCL
ncbi:inosine triphosphate pyrophosphatase-like [Gigantopelta aegis]|uniref:inosine triphosphate pyrophosphatase-like n=1 Tax=Gigantopelta aegis TaxID=1735272 RepID=UPI001B88D54F|nr:inosine triphosphate pyrophosphatase-like [Gigantopelta aegis]XP_041358634.1 inosine triphosphate pyrophosphatase-like [Gigantopelta aegis]XP_041358635.1 inosine triphosphate pyrophosphatase-like [Gigantopelta aegis]XP_041358637.1 inosine triphosphate pyrophosphatase-like [Gigantopelta aegis]XP_041358638.1 inosine triphosphate pyrophosphatase-like [Gigantopelta aegis]